MLGVAIVELRFLTCMSLGDLRRILGLDDHLLLHHLESAMGRRDGCVSELENYTGQGEALGP